MDDRREDEESLRERFSRAQLRRPDGTPLGTPLPGADVRLGTTGLPQATDLTPAVPAPAAPTPPTGGDAMDLERLAPGVKGSFIAETRDDLQELRRDLLQLERYHDEVDTLRDMGRLCHKIKGSSATLGYDSLATLAHTFEDMLQAVFLRREPASEHDLTLLEQGLTLLTTCLDAAVADSVPDPRMPAEATRLLEELRGREPAPVQNEHTGEATAPLFAVGSGRTTNPGEHGATLRVDVRRLDELMGRVSSLATNRAMLARLRQDVARFHQDLDAALVRLKGASAQVADWQPLMQRLAVAPTSAGQQGRTDAHAPRALPRPALPGGASDERAGWTWPGISGGSLANAGEAAGATALEHYGELDQALRTLAEAVDDVTSSSAGLGMILQRFSHAVEAQEALMAQMQQDVAAIRLVPLYELVLRLQLAARQLAMQRRKAIDFSVRGEMTQIDRDISEALAAPLLQLVRNAIIHGIESPEERREVSKPERGRVWLHASHDGNEVSIEVGDDGCGIDLSLLIGAAITAGMVSPDAGRALTEAEALDLMFVHGLTTLDDADVAAGHGIGLDEVRNVVERLRGSITVMSDVGTGTIFRIRVPISLSVLKVLHIGTAGGAYALPFAAVRHTLSIAADDIRTTAAPAPLATGTGPVRMSRRVRIAQEHVHVGSGTLSTPGTVEEVPAFALAELLGYEYQPRHPQPALLLDVSQRRVALLVDVVFDEHEVVVQALPRYLRRRGVRGATVTLDGQVLLLLDISELAAGVLEGRRALPPPRPAPRFARAQAPRVLVVDDSNSMRSALESVLTRAGYDVQLARDGFEALGLLLESLPQAMILDLEMPRLDGFGLLKVLRSAPQFTGLRVAVLTSKASERHRTQARALGADDYLIKPCPDSLLLAALERLLRGQPAAR